MQRRAFELGFEPPQMLQVHMRQRGACRICCKTRALLDIRFEPFSRRLESRQNPLAFKVAATDSNVCFAGARFSRFQ